MMTHSPKWLRVTALILPICASLLVFYFLGESWLNGYRNALRKEGFDYAMGLIRSSIEKEGKLMFRVSDGDGKTRLVNLIIQEGKK